VAEDKFVSFLETKAKPGNLNIVALSQKGASDLFKELQSRGKSKSPYYYIPFNNPRDFCYVRAEQMATDPLVNLYARQGVPFAKIWLATPGHKENLRAISFQHGKVKTPAGDYYVAQQSQAGPSGIQAPPASAISQRHIEERPDGSVMWSYHVALISLVSGSNGNFRAVVFDPSVANDPLSPEEWRKLANFGDAYCWPMTVKWYGPVADPRGLRPARYEWNTIEQVTKSGEKERVLRRAQAEGWNEQKTFWNLIPGQEDWPAEAAQFKNFADGKLKEAGRALRDAINQLSDLGRR
jgi:hypothetical protein